MTFFSFHMSQNTRTYQLKTSIAGGIAGCLAKTVVAPLDRVKILFQTNNPSFVKYSGSFLGVFLATKSIYLDSGIHGLLQGHSATLLRIYPYASIKFAAYEQFKLLLAKNSNKNTIGARRFLAGALAGSCI